VGAFCPPKDPSEPREACLACPEQAQRAEGRCFATQELRVWLASSPRLAARTTLF